MQEFKDLLFTMLLGKVISPETARDLYGVAARITTPVAAPERTSFPLVYSALALVMDHIAEGRQIYAIKAYRAEFGTDLRTAKLACDALRDKLHDAQKRAIRRGQPDLADW